MSKRTLFLSWQDKADSREWFPVGRLDADAERSEYRFRYTGGAKRAQQQRGFPLVADFPDLERDYRAERLWAMFRNRVIAPGRPDFEEYLHNLDLERTQSDPIEILSANGGRRETDAYEVFPKIIRRPDGTFSCRFFLHGWRYVSQQAQSRLSSLNPGDELSIALELTNPVTQIAVQVQTRDYSVLGWTPRYLVPDLALAVAEAPSEYSARVVRVNPQPSPSRQRVLIEMSGKWVKHEPMSGSDFMPLGGDEAELAAEEGDWTTR